MKKITTIATIFILGISCSKEKITPEKQCNCGVIVSDDVKDYSVYIRNRCTGNVKKFYLYRGDWMTAYVGIDYCILNTEKW